MKLRSGVSGVARDFGIDDSSKVTELVQASVAPDRLDRYRDFGGLVLQKSKNTVLGLLDHSVLEGRYEADLFFKLHASIYGISEYIKPNIAIGRSRSSSLGWLSTRLSKTTKKGMTTSNR